MTNILRSDCRTRMMGDLEALYDSTERFEKLRKHGDLTSVSKHRMRPVERHGRRTRPHRNSASTRHGMNRRRVRKIQW